MSLSDHIGRTPVVKLKNSPGQDRAEIWAKLENLNPAGSLKERICVSILEDAENKGLIHPGKTTIVEASSGNTGVSMAVYCNIKGYDLVIVMPEYIDEERKQIINVYGGKVELSPAIERMEGSIRLARKIAQENDNHYLLDQFENSRNPETHRKSTAVEIYEQVPGNVDAFVMGVGTGGTITGVASFLKENYQNTSIVAVEPAECAVLSGEAPGDHRIYGIGAGFIPPVLNRSLIDEVFKVSTEQAIEYTKMLSAREGILVGISSGANYFASKEIAKRLGPGKQVVTIFCDTGERYLNMGIYREDTSFNFNVK